MYEFNSIHSITGYHKLNSFLIFTSVAQRIDGLGWRLEAPARCGRSLLLFSYSVFPGCKVIGDLFYLTTPTVTD